MTERINMKCPSCNGSFIFIGEGGYLTCSYVDCPEPDVAKKVNQLEAERDDYRNQYHMAEAKVLSRDALLEQLSEEQLTKDVAKAEAEIEALREAFSHTHVNNQEDDACKECGLDLRNAIHRSG